MPSTLNILSDNHSGIDAAQAEATLRSESPHLLASDERVELAFQSPSARERTYWTNLRVLVAEGRGLTGQLDSSNTGKKQKLVSIPYRSIKAFAVQTAGKSVLDRDTELKLWFSGSSGSYGGPKTIDFARNAVDLVMIQRYFNDKLFASDDSNSNSNGNSHSNHSNGNGNTEPLYTPAPTPTPTSTDNNESNNDGFLESLLDLIGNDARQVDPGLVTDKFGSEGSKFACLMPGEDVELAYQVANRDLVLVTSVRLVVIDVKGLGPSSRIEFFSIRWSCVKAFSVETAGGWDFDGKFVIYTNISSMRKIQQDLRKTPSLETMTTAIQMAFADKLLGSCSSNGSDSGGTNTNNNLSASAVSAAADRASVVPYDYGTLYGGSNKKPLDPAAIEKLYKTNPCILRNDEKVALAFRGRRDIVVFTNQRILDVDVKGWSGQKVRYSSIPYTSVLGFGIKTAGKNMDLDAEVMVYTEVRWESLGEEPDPGMSYLEWDFNKTVVDVMELQIFLAKCILPTAVAVPSNPYPSTSTNTTTTGTATATKTPPPPPPPPPTTTTTTPLFIDVFKEAMGDHEAVDSEAWNNALHAGTYPVLLECEKLEMAFKAGRDAVCFTDQRLLVLDTKGWSGQKIKYTSVPYPHIKAFSAESAGKWDRDSTLAIFTKNHWTLGKLKLDFRKTKTDILKIEKFLSAKILGAGSPTTSAPPPPPPEKRITAPAGVNGFTDWIIDFSIEEDPEVANAQLHSDPPILLPTETVELVYREGRDLWVYTDRRLLMIDVKGLSGTKVKYKSIPWKGSVSAFAVKTEGLLDIDTECYIYTNTPTTDCVTQKLLLERKNDNDNKPENNNIFELHRYLGTKVL